jgi:transposase-like protein
MRAILARWTLGIGVHLERRWTLPSKRQSFPETKEVSVGSPRPRRSIAEKRRIVEETLAPGASVARVARAHGINANQVFWMASALPGGKAWFLTESRRGIMRIRRSL